MLYSTFEKKF